MSKKKKEAHSSGFENIEKALTRAEQYVEENKRSLLIIVAVIILIAGGFMLWYFKIYKPKEVEAQAAIYPAEQKFAQDNFREALEDNIDGTGFLKIIDEYGITNTGNLAHYYAGISHLRLGEYKQAIEQLKNFDSDDPILSAISLGAIGDAYVELGNYKEAVEFFEKASEENPNDFTSPIYLKKAGLTYEALKDKENALASYEKIKNDFPASPEAGDIDKFIQAVSMK